MFFLSQMSVLVSSSENSIFDDVKYYVITTESTFQRCIDYLDIAGRP